MTVFPSTQATQPALDSIMLRTAADYNQLVAYGDDRIALAARFASEKKV
jgi:hypothetical protein